MHLIVCDDADQNERFAFEKKKKNSIQRSFVFLYKNKDRQIFWWKLNHKLCRFQMMQSIAWQEFTLNHNFTEVHAFFRWQ